MISVQHVNKKAWWCAQNPSSLRPPEVILGTSLSKSRCLDVGLTGESLSFPEPQGDTDYLTRVTQLTGETFDAVVWKESQFMLCVVRLLRTVLFLS